MLPPWDKILGGELSTCHNSYIRSPAPSRTPNPPTEWEREPAPGENRCSPKSFKTSDRHFRFKRNAGLQTLFSPIKTERSLGRPPVGLVCVGSAGDWVGKLTCALWGQRAKSGLMFCWILTFLCGLATTKLESALTRTELIEVPGMWVKRMTRNAEAAGRWEFPGYGTRFIKQ